MAGAITTTREVLFGPLVFLPNPFEPIENAFEQIRLSDFSSHYIEEVSYESHVEIFFGKSLGGLSHLN